MRFENVCSWYKRRNYDAMTDDPIRLTQFAKRAGCAAKQPPGYLLSLLGSLPPITDPNVLVGSATADDAAVYKLSDDLALVFTTDFFTPIVDRPYDFGAVAAANALSDVYAMGGTPLTALSIVGFPDAVLAAGSAGGNSARGRRQSGGGRASRSSAGTRSNRRSRFLAWPLSARLLRTAFLSNDKAQPGDVLILTKPLGLGIITTAAKNGEDKLGAIDDAIRVMTTLNRVAGEEFVRAGVHALTDVTGFGLLGHLRNIVAASKVGARIFFDRVPVLPAAANMCRPEFHPAARTPITSFLPTG